MIDITPVGYVVVLGKSDINSVPLLAFERSPNAFLCATGFPDRHNAKSGVSSYPNIKVELLHLGAVKGIVAFEQETEVAQVGGDKLLTELFLRINGTTTPLTKAAVGIVGCGVNGLYLLLVQFRSSRSSVRSSELRFLPPARVTKGLAVGAGIACRRILSEVEATVGSILELRVSSDLTGNGRTISVSHIEHEAVVNSSTCIKRSSRCTLSRESKNTVVDDNIGRLLGTNRTIVVECAVVNSYLGISFGCTAILYINSLVACTRANKG